MSAIKYSFIMPYIDRAWQLRNTLISFAEHYKGRDDVELSIVEDVKNFESKDAHALLLQALEILPSSVLVTLNVGGDIKTLNAAPRLNQAVRQSYGQYIILCSPEIFHLHDVLSELDEIYSKNKHAYVMVSCIQGVSCARDIMSLAEFKYVHNRWYQHSLHRNVERPFMACISRKMWNELGGFDEAYKDGWGYEDDDWRNRLKEAGIETTHLDSHPVVHQEHPKWTGHPRYREMIVRNKAIYQERWPNA